MTRRFRAGIIGAGFIAGVHAHAMRAAGGVVSRVAGATPEESALAVERMHADRAAGSVEDLVTADDVDAVHVCTPNAAQAALAIRAGKHVICEKPLATTTETRGGWPS
jgi:predicted dehydrogenase